MKDWDWTDWRDQLWLAMMVVLVSSIAIALGPGYAATWTWLGNNSSNVASWVQAVGSIAAIAAGFAIARYQLARQAKEAVERELEAQRVLKTKQLFLLRGRFEAISTWAEATEKDVQRDKPNWDSAIAFADELLKAFGSLTPNDYPTAVAATIVATVTTNLRGQMVLFALNAKKDFYSERSMQAMAASLRSIRKSAEVAQAWAEAQIKRVVTAAELTAFNEEAALVLHIHHGGDPVAFKAA